MAFSKYIVISYLLSGIAQVRNDLSGSIISGTRPSWANQPTIIKIIIFGLAWPISVIMKAYSRSTVIFILSGLLRIILRLTLYSLITWITYNIFYQLINDATLIILATLVTVTIISFYTLSLKAGLEAILVLPMEFLFKILDHKKNSEPTETIKWCRTCKHHIKKLEYEDFQNGLWNSKSIPDSILLPCAIVAETNPTWKHYFELAPAKRTLFPRDCLSYEAVV